MFPRIFVFALLSASLAACGGAQGSQQNGVAGCPDDLPQGCPTVLPSYQNDVVPALQRNCTSCHSPGGEARQRDLTTHAAVKAQADSALRQIAQCLMPPDGHPQASADDRALLMTWLLCGAPNN